jgi:hypothetical protein
MSNSPPPYLYESRQIHWGSPYTAESGDDSQADVTASAMSEASCSEAAAAAATAAAATAAIVMVQQYNIGLHPSPRRRVEEVGKEPRVEESILGAQMGMVEYHVIVGGGGWLCHYHR